MTTESKNKKTIKSIKRQSPVYSMGKQTDQVLTISSKEFNEDMNFNNKRVKQNKKNKSKKEINEKNIKNIVDKKVEKSKTIQRKNEKKIKRSTKNIKQSKTPKMPSIKVAFLGGLNEIGKNITLFECEDDMFLLDCGMTFPDGEMLGVDLV